MRCFHIRKGEKIEIPIGSQLGGEPGWLRLLFKTAFTNFAYKKMFPRKALRGSIIQIHPGGPDSPRFAVATKLLSQNSHPNSDTSPKPENPTLQKLRGTRQKKNKKERKKERKATPDTRRRGKSTCRDILGSIRARKGARGRHIRARARSRFLVALARHTRGTGLSLSRASERSWESRGSPADQVASFRGTGSGARISARACAPEALDVGGCEGCGLMPGAVVVGLGVGMGGWVSARRRGELENESYGSSRRRGSRLQQDGLLAPYWNFSLLKFSKVVSRFQW